MCWSLLRLQKQSRLLCDRTILNSEEQLWTKTEDTEAPHLHETSHTTSCTEQRYMHLQKNSYNRVLIITNAAKTKQTTLWSNNFAFRGAVMNYKWRYGSATQIYTKHRTLLAPQSNVTCISKKIHTLVYWSLLGLQKKNRIVCDRTILHSGALLWTITEYSEAPHLHEISHTTISTQQRCMQLHKKLRNPSVLIITKAAKTKQTTQWSNNFALRGAVMNQNWRYGSTTSTRNIAHY